MKPRDMIDELVDSIINLSDDPESDVCVEELAIYKNILKRLEIVDMLEKEFNIVVGKIEGKKTNSLSLLDLGLPVRAFNVLWRYYCSLFDNPSEVTLDRIYKDRNDILRLKYLGKRGLYQINEAFKKITGETLYSKEAISSSVNLIKQY